MEKDSDLQARLSKEIQPGLVTIDRPGRKAKATGVVNDERKNRSATPDDHNHRINLCVRDSEYDWILARAQEHSRTVPQEARLILRDGINDIKEGFSLQRFIKNPRIRDWVQNNADRRQVSFEEQVQFFLDIVYSMMEGREDAARTEESD